MARRLPEPPVPGAELLKASDSSLHPDVWMLPGDSPRVWKTFRRSLWPIRVTVGRWLAGREARNLRLLRGIEGVPQFLSMPDPWTIEMTYLDAQPVPEKHHALSAEWFDELQAILAEMHARGLNHGDLRRRNLLMRRDDGSPCLLDFAQCMHAPRRDSLFWKLVMKRAIEVDDYTLIKLKKWYIRGQNMPAHEREIFRNSKPAHLKFGQFLKKKMYGRVALLFSPARRKRRRRRRTKGKL